MVNFAKGVVVLWVFICVAVNRQDTRDVIIGDTTFIGYRKTTVDDIEFYSWKGVRYAEAFKGDLRFKAPQPVVRRPPVVDCEHHSDICPQTSFLMRINKPQSEDCLAANIYVPATFFKTGALLPVFFFIHGSANLEGSADDFMYKGDNILAKDIVVVTINYRVGMFGSLSLGTKECSGNQGLKDQRFALKWISENIRHFGGDPERLTLCGESSGASVVHLHVANAESRRYFQRAIIMSGALTNPWAVQYDSSVHKRLREELAERAGQTVNPNDPPEALVPFYQNTDFRTLISHMELEPNRVNLDFTYSPIIESGDALHPFMTEDPRRVIETTDIDIQIMFGTCSLEGLYFAKDDMEFDFFTPISKTRMTVNRDTVYALDTNERRIQDLYYSNVLHNIIPIARLLGDLNFVFGIEVSIRIHAGQPTTIVYHYKFAVDALFNWMKKKTHPYVQSVSTHGDDLCFVFVCGFIPIADENANVYSLAENVLITTDIGRITNQAMRNMVSIFENVIKHGEPSPENVLGAFEKVQRDRMNFILVNNDGMEPGVDPYGNMHDTWLTVENRISAAA